MHGRNIIQTFSQSQSVGDLKRIISHNPYYQLFSFEENWFGYNSVNDGHQEVVVLDDDNMPLHFYGLQDDAQLQMVKKGYSIVVIDEKGRELYFEIEKNTTFAEVKEKLMKVLPRDVLNVSLFYCTRNNNKVVHNKVVDVDVKVLDVVANRSVVYLITNKFALNKNFRVGEHLRCMKIYGIEDGDTMLSVRLRCPAVGFRYLETKGSSDIGSTRYIVLPGHVVFARISLN